MANNLSEFISESGTILLTVDAVTRLMATSKNTLSRYPIEGGGKVTEHISSENMILSIEGVVSDATPDKATETTIKIDSIQGFLPNLGYGNPEKPIVKINDLDPVQTLSTKASDARLALQRLRDTKVLFSYRTPSHLFQNMVMVSLDFNRERTTGNSVPFKARLEQVTFATSEVTTKAVKAEAIVPSSGPTKDGGVKVGEEVDVNEVPTSAIQHFQVELFNDN